jgi:hypothetical protein
MLLRWHPYVVVERLALKWEKLVSARHDRDGSAMAGVSHSTR